MRNKKDLTADIVTIIFVGCVLLVGTTLLSNKGNTDTKSIFNCVVLCFIVVSLLISGIYITWIRYFKKSYSPINREQEQQRFFPRKFLHSSESHFYLILRETIQSINPAFHVTPKIGLWAAVEQRDQRDWNRINQKHIDFAIYSFGLYKACRRSRLT